MKAKITFRYDIDIDGRETLFIKAYDTNGDMVMNTDYPYLEDAIEVLEEYYPRTEWRKVKAREV